MTDNPRTLEEFLEIVLLHVFPHERLKRKIEPGTKSIGFACPFCGDSKTNPNAKRGHLYPVSKTFKCYNDGCMKWMPLRKFVGHFVAAYGIDITELEIDFDMPAHDKPHMQLASNDMLQYLVEVGVFDQLPTVSQLIYRFDLRNISEMTPDTEAGKFIAKRKLANVPEAYDCVFSDPSDKLIYIFNFHKQSGKVLSYTTRKLLQKKYKIEVYSDMCKALHIPVAEAHAPILDSLSNYFNVFNVDLNKPIKILEGQIDSMFVYNSIAMQGVTKDNILAQYMSPENIYTMFDRDKAGTEASIEELNEGHRVFMWGLLVTKMKRAFSDYYKEICKIKDTNDLYIFLYDRTGLPLWKFNEMMDRYYTSNKLDLLYI